MDRRLPFAIAILAALVAGALALATLTAAPATAAGEHALRVVGPAEVLFDATVRAEEATALGVLLAGAAQGGFDVELERYPMGAYVRAIGDHRAAGASGWLYEVGRGDQWILGDRSAERYGLEPGDAVRWRWTEDGS